MFQTPLEEQSPVAGDLDDHESADEEELPASADMTSPKEYNAAAGDENDLDEIPNSAEPPPGIQVLGSLQESDEDEEEEEEDKIAAKHSDEEGEEIAATRAANLLLQPAKHSDEEDEEINTPRAGNLLLQPARQSDEECEEEKREDEIAASKAASLLFQPAQESDEECEADDATRHQDPTTNQTAMVMSETMASNGDVDQFEHEGIPSTLVPVEHSRDFGLADGGAGALPAEVADAMMKLPKSVYGRLYGYQRQGVAWMMNLFHQGFGGILGDEMGLGKTVQTAAFLACLKCTDQGSNFLVVCPVTLLEQWKRELQTWTKDTGLAVQIMHGTSQERTKALSALRRRGGVLLTSYDLVRNCVHTLRTAGLACNALAMTRKRKRQDTRATRDDDSISEAEDEPSTDPNGGMPVDAHMKWDVVVVDEAQTIKNPSCVCGRALRKIEARCRILLTGTPLQNKLGDLWALMDFAQPGLLGNHATFDRNFSEQIAKGSKRNASRFTVELKDHLARELKRITAPHCLRRLKSEVNMSSPDVAMEAQASHVVPGQLPPKVDVVLWLNLTSAQLELYNLCLKSDIVRRATGEEKCGMEALRAIGLLKKISNHPLLCLPPEDFNQWKAEVVSSAAAAADAGSSLPTDMSDRSPPRSPQKLSSAGGEGIDEDDADATLLADESQHMMARLRALVPGSVHGAALLSCKLRVLSVLLPQLQKRGHRCLIFSQSTRMLDLVQACVLRVLGLKFLRIDGTILPRDRDIKVAKFQQPDSRYFCICLSVQTGGTGLTVTGADRVILVDPAWNPSVDAQAIDRVHRIGQQKDVVVYRLIGSGAIEDKMFRLQVFKRSLANTYLEQESQVRFFSPKDLKALFEAPDKSTSTQTLMYEQIGREALEHEDLLRVVANDIGSTDDPQALPFWQSSDVLGFSDYQRLFMFLEQPGQEEDKAVEKAKDLTARLRNEEYVKDQVLEGKFKASQRDSAFAKENMPPDAMPIQGAGP